MRYLTLFTLLAISTSCFAMESEPDYDVHHCGEHIDLDEGVDFKVEGDI